MHVHTVSEVVVGVLWWSLIAFLTVSARLTPSLHVPCCSLAVIHSHVSQNLLIPTFWSAYVTVSRTECPMISSSLVQTQ